MTLPGMSVGKAFLALGTAALLLSGCYYNRPYYPAPHYGPPSYGPGQHYYHGKAPRSGYGHYHHHGYRGPY